MSSTRNSMTDNPFRDSARNLRLPPDGDSLISPPALKPIPFLEWQGRSTSCGSLGRHYEEGDSRLASLRFDESAASDRLWELLLSEDDRLAAARRNGLKIVGTMKDLGTVPVMAYALPELRAFYPDGAWWTPCIMQNGDGLFAIADRLGVDDSFCPVRAMLGAFVAGNRFPIPDLLTCSVGAICDDFSAIAQRVEALGHPILWWEMPYRRAPEPHEQAVLMENGMAVPKSQVDVVCLELERIRQALSDLAERQLSDAMLAEGIRRANQIRNVLGRLREAVFTAPRSPLPALELLIAEMLVIHFCSDRDATASILSELLELVNQRIAQNAGYGSVADVKVFWVNPTADLRAMIVLEDCGARLCGTDFLFTHALDPISETLPPITALAQSALSDPMVGPSDQRIERIISDMRKLGAEALVVSRIPGASHCAHEGKRITEQVAQKLSVPCIEIEIPSLTDAFAPALRTRIEALVETAKARRDF